MDVESLYDYLRKKKVDLKRVSINVLRKAEVLIVDENGQKKKGFSLYKCLVCEIELQDGPSESEEERRRGGRVYHLVEGVWYNVDRNFLEKIQIYLDNLYRDKFLRKYMSAKEGRYNMREDEYNKFAAGEISGICLDRTSIAPVGERQVEPCDILIFRENHVELIHVKKYRSSKELSHLFNQGVNAVRLLVLNETGAARQLVENIRKICGKKVEEKDEEKIKK